MKRIVVAMAIVMSAAGRGEAKPTATIDPSTFEHTPPRAGFLLTGTHAQLPCESCHKQPGVYTGAAPTCQGCHLPPKHGAFGACTQCHNSTTSWIQTTFSHDRTAFPLDGRHAFNINATCETCHQVLRPGVFKQAHDPCVLCHTDTHAGAKRRFSCAACHSTSVWTPIANVHTKATTACATCHQAKHGATYGPSCSTCHQDTKRWDVTRPFDHQQTMFPLDRRHRAASCKSCHDPQQHARVEPRCSACHDDPHRGRAQRECEDCHRGDRWTIIRWDHDRSLFPLRGRHFGTPCRDCHTNDEFTGLRAECVACHRGDAARANAKESQHARFGFDCADCHKPFKW